jgi:Mrp family chromosome partitioning ATPase
MNDHRRIPVPDGKKKPEETRDSLIERAVTSFDLRSFTPPPVPEALARMKPKAKVPEASSEPEVAPATVQATVEQDGEPRAVPPQQADDEPAPRIEPEPAPRPVEFRGRVYPVDRKRLLEQGMIEPEGKVTTLLEEFRIVKRRLLAQAADLRRRGAGGSAQRILVSSPHPGEGKTYCAINLALSIAAEKENEVLLVDADFAKPSVLDVLGLPEGPGLMDALSAEDSDVTDFVMATNIPGLCVLPAGSASNSDSEYLTSSRTPRILDRLTEGAPHRIVILDSSPALAVSTAAELARHVAQAVMVVRADSTGQGALEDAISLLSACPNVQLLLNGAQFSPSGRRFGDYGYRG